MTEQLELWNRNELKTETRWADGYPDVDKMLKQLEPSQYYSARARSAKDIREFLSVFTGGVVTSRAEYFVTLETTSWKFYFN